MSSGVDTPTHLPPQMSGPAFDKQTLRRTAPALVAPLAAYAIVRPLVSSDTLCLAIAGAIPIFYTIALALVRHRIDHLALLTAAGFAIACLISVLTGSLPLKLHEALIAFGIGIVVLIAALIRRPLPLGRLARIPSPTKEIDSSLGAMVGGFLILHALLHLVLAVSLSTSSYLVLSKVIDWGTLALGGLALAAYARSVRARNS
jgi:hypothetical protein